MKKGDKVYLVKYALTKGITEETVNENFRRGPTLFGRGYYIFETGREVAATKEEALKIAEVIRLNKIQSLRKSLCKLEKMKFEIKAAKS
jgi:hypothetical protein